MKKWILQGLAFAGAVALVATVTVTTAAALQDNPPNANGLIGLFTGRGTATADTGGPGLRITVLPAPDEEKAEEADHDREGGTEEYAGADMAPETGDQAPDSHTEATHEPLSTFASQSTVNTGTTWQVISNTLSATVTVLECPTIDPPEADYDLVHPADVATNITWGDATAIDRIEDDIGLMLVEDSHYTVDDDILNILDSDDFLGLVLTEPGQKLVLTIYFDVCDPITFTITAVLTEASIVGSTREVNCDILPYVTVTLYDEHDNEIASTESDEHGHYTLPVPEEGDYRLVASKEGFIAESQTISVTGPTTTVNFISGYGLIPDPTETSYVLACISLWKTGDPPCHLTSSRVLAVISVWKAD